jgi:putative serine protease PepD
MGAILNAKAGITPGEIITAVGDIAVHSTSDLVSALAKLDPGTSVPVTVSDGQGHSHPVTVTLDQLPGS